MWCSRSNSSLVPRASLLCAWLREYVKGAACRLASRNAAPAQLVVVLKQDDINLLCNWVLQIHELQASLVTHQQQLSTAESGRRADTQAAEARLQLLTQQMAQGEAAMLRRVTGTFAGTLPNADSQVHLSCRRG